MTVIFDTLTAFATSAIVVLAKPSWANSVVAAAEIASRVSCF